jgi:NTP pyrophosphatase (non-canonical NTP hydrolase)
MNEEIEIIKSAIRKNGKAMQTVVAIEEMSELQKELSKFIRGKGNRDNLIEEVADVLVMITQIQLMYALPDNEVERIMRLKLNRLKERMEQNANVGKMSEKTDGDLISRESVITMLNKIENAVEDGDGFQFNEWVEYAKDIPNAEKTAVFKIVGNTKQPYECSKCNEPVDGWDKFCKHCGARLVL